MKGMHQFDKPLTTREYFCYLKMRRFANRKVYFDNSNIYIYIYIILRLKRNSGYSVSCYLGRVGKEAEVLLWKTTIITNRESKRNWNLFVDGFF